jgi:hypothetical protein
MPRRAAARNLTEIRLASPTESNAARHRETRLIEGDCLRNPQSTIERPVMTGHAADPHLERVDGPTTHHMSVPLAHEHKHQ